MEQILDTFHLDGTLLLAQLVNFIIVFIVLYFLVSKPLTILMSERAEKIEQGLSNAKHFDEKIQALQDERDVILKEAKVQATNIVEEAKTHAQEQSQASLLKTKKQVEAIITQAKEDMVSMKESMIKEIKKESMDIIIEVTKKVVPELTSEKEKITFLEKRIEELT